MPQYIKRLIIAFAFFVFLFLILQQLLKPVSFGALGHYRSDAIRENSAAEMHYAGLANCTSCHDSLRMEKSRRVACRAYLRGLSWSGLEACIVFRTVWSW